MRATSPQLVSRLGLWGRASGGAGLLASDQVGTPSERTADLFSKIRSKIIYLHTVGETSIRQGFSEKTSRAGGSMFHHGTLRSLLVKSVPRVLKCGVRVLRLYRRGRNIGDRRPWPAPAAPAGSQHETRRRASWRLPRHCFDFSHPPRPGWRGDAGTRRARRGELGIRPKRVRPSTSLGNQRGARGRDAQLIEPVFQRSGPRRRASSRKRRPLLVSLQL